MKKKILKTFFVYSYITLLCYVGSENALNMAKVISEKSGNKKLKIECLWKTTLKRFKEYWKLLND